MLAVGLIKIAGLHENDPDAIKIVPHEHHAAFPWWSEETRAILEALTVEDVDGKAALDFGCGASCILALAAVKLGAKTVLAVENYPPLDEIARRQVLANGAADKITVVQQTDGGSFDFAFCNCADDDLLERIQTVVPHGLGTNSNAALVRW